MKKHGFTLIELLTALIILGILAAIAIPGFSRWMPDIRLKAAARDLKSDMELAKLRAIRENANVVLTFDIANNKYTLFLDNGAGGGVPGDLKQNGSEVTIKTVTMPVYVTIYEASFSGGVPRFRFDSRGLPNGFGGHAYMNNTKNSYRGISLSMVGHVQIQESTDGGTTWSDID